MLAKVLDAAPHRKVWLLTFEPSLDEYVIDIQAAVYVNEQKGPTPEVQATPQIPGN